MWRCCHIPCTSRVGKGIRVYVSGRRSARAASARPNLLSCWCALKSACGLAISASRALFSHSMLGLNGLRGHPWCRLLVVARKAYLKWGFGHELAPPGVVLRQVSPFSLGRWKAEAGQVALKRPAEGHLSTPATQGSAIQKTMRRFGKRFVCIHCKFTAPTRHTDANPFIDQGRRAGGVE